MEKKNKIILGGIIFIVLIALGVGIYYLFFYEKPKAPPVQEITKAEPAQIPAEKAVVEEKALKPIQVGLNESDDVVRELARALSINPKFASWLMSKGLIRKFTAAVDNIAQGLSPRSQVDFFTPKGGFKVIDKKGISYANPESYGRYNPAADVFASLDAKACVQLYRRLESPVQEAYRELGYPEQKFNETLTQAIMELLKVPVVKGGMPLEAKVISFAIADPKLENLSEAQKHLLRMGPENVQKIQAKLRELASELGIPENKLPRAKVYSSR